MKNIHAVPVMAPEVAVAEVNSWHTSAAAR
jgi:hypothetical protein